MNDFYTRLLRMHTRFTTITLAAVLILLPGVSRASTLAAGAQITGYMQQAVNTKTAHDGQRIVIATKSGSMIIGHLSEVVAATPTKKAHIKLNFDSIRFADGTREPIYAQVVRVQRVREYNIAMAAGEILVGDVVGNVVGKAVGTKIGGLVGLLGGALYAYNTAANIVIPANASLTIQLLKPLTVP